MSAAPVQQGSLRFRLMEPVLHVQILLVLALALGGGGVAYGLRNLVIQLAALAVLGLQAPLVRQFLRKAPRALVLLVGASLVLPLLQLLPLPSALWEAFPGRGPLAEGLGLAGAGEQPWFTTSVSPVRTLVAFCGTILPATVIVIGTNMTSAHRQRLAYTVLIGALAAMLLGVFQLSSANSAGLLYFERPEAGVLYATFANRNSTGMLFVLALCLLSGLPLPRARHWQLGLLCGGVLLVVAVVLTKSRTSMVLLTLPLGMALLRAGWAYRQARGGKMPSLQRVLLGGLALSLLAAAAIGWSAYSGGRAADSFARFSDTSTDRPEMWEDGLYAAHQYWPVGAGTGAFDDVFQVHESLEYVSPRRAGRAHNDYIELAIESGVAGLLLAALWLGWCGLAALRAMPSADRWLRLAAGAGIAAIALQSLLDYPLRNQSLLGVAAVLVVLLARQRREVRP